MGISDEDCVTAARLILTSYALDNLDTIGRHILQFMLIRLLDMRVRIALGDYPCATLGYMGVDCSNGCLCS
jgi:hypothetical protein